MSTCPPPVRRFEPGARWLGAVMVAAGLMGAAGPLLAQPANQPARAKRHGNTGDDGAGDALHPGQQGA